ncbi:hypothetical protein KAZ01_00870 [Candidatus Gracilibacteria bacterium]|nr:hypothetical protein [Candidatus Gracilibacteria bacterium]
MGKLQKFIFTSLAVTTLVQQSFAADTTSSTEGGLDFGQGNVDARIAGGGTDAQADTLAQTVIGNALLLIGIIAVAFGIYGGFLVMTAAGDDGKAKKGKTILLQAGIGIIIIFLANSIVQLVIRSIATSSTPATGS